MAGISGFVRVAVDGAGKRIMNLLHTDFFGAGADGYQQLIGITDPTDPTKVAAVFSAMPAPSAYGVATREAAPNFDSGLVTLTDTAASITTDTIKGGALVLCNITGGTRGVTLTNTAGTKYMNDYPLQKNMTIFILFGRMSLAGIKWNASANGSVNGQFVGDKE